MRRAPFLFILASVIFLLESCTARIVKLQVLGASYCNNTRYNKVYEVLSDEQILEIFDDPELKSRFSQKTIKISIAYDFWRDLKELAKREKVVSSDLNYIQDTQLLRERVYQHLHFVQSDINATASELRCYVDRFTEILVDMKETEDNIVQENTFKAIASGAMGGLLDGSTVYMTGVNQAIILTTGVFVSYYSYLAYEPSVVVEFKPRTTILKEIWTNPSHSQNFSMPLWFLISRDWTKNSSYVTMREKLVKRWEDNRFLGEGDDRETKIELFFGKGGLSNVKEMENRREMIIELKGLIQLLEQDLRNFQGELLHRQKLGE